MTNFGINGAGRGKHRVLALILALGSANAPLAATAMGIVSGTTGTTTSALSRAKICLQSDTTACWLTRTSGAFALGYTATVPDDVIVGVHSARNHSAVRLNGKTISLPIVQSGDYRFEAVNSSGRILDRRELSLTKGMQQVSLPASVTEAGISFLRITGPGTAWSGRLVLGKGSLTGSSSEPAAGFAARITASLRDSLVVSASGFRAKTIAIPNDSASRLKMSVTLVRDSLLPRFNPDPGVFYGTSFSLSMSFLSGTGAIRYTTDGSAPSVLSAGYSSALTISTDTSLTAQIFNGNTAIGSAVTGWWKKSMGITPTPGIYSGHVVPKIAKLLGDERYTLDGRVPTPNDPLWTSRTDSTLLQDAFLVLRSFQANSYPEAIEYTVKDTSLNPRGSDRTFFDTAFVKLSSLDSAEIRYTLDGKAPSLSSTLYTGPFNIAGTCTVRAIAYRNGHASDTAKYVYTMLPPPAPVLDTSAVKGYQDSVRLALYGCKGCAVYYTLDGTAPLYDKPATLVYSGPITLKAGQTLQAMSGTRNQSALVKWSYASIAPHILPDSGLLTGQTTASVTMTTSSPIGAVIRYTVDGSVPNSNSPGYLPGTSPAIVLSSFPVTVTAKTYSAKGDSSHATQVTCISTPSGIQIASASTAQLLDTNMTFVDSRDGQTYRATAIGNRLWMAQNLNYANVGVCYNSSADSCAKYGRLYTWSQALGLGDSCNAKACVSYSTSGICPTGWHVPSYLDWDSLTVAANSTSYYNVAGTRIKSISDWKYSSNVQPNANDVFGFSGKPGGFFSNRTDMFAAAGNRAEWWSSTLISGSKYAKSYNTTYDYAPLTPTTSVDKTTALSVRCVKDLVITR
ncbi:MAG: hypothetical protein RL318_112 [Fibrobacterota bacterium]|jgi:uncharacterized protein (TIGR02145 family)